MTSENSHAASENSHAAREAFDTSSRALAARFMAVALGQMRSGRECREAARLAFSYARRAVVEEGDGVLQFPGVRRNGEPA